MMMMHLGVTLTFYDYAYVLFLKDFFFFLVLLLVLCFFVFFSFSFFSRMYGVTADTKTTILTKLHDDSMTYALPAD